MLDWKCFNRLRVYRGLRLEKNAVIQQVNADNSVSTISLAEQAVLDGVTAGTVTASKAVVVDLNKDIASFRNLTSTGTITSNAIAGGDSSLGVDGLAAAQGGAIVVTGGASSTSANAGGAVSLVGGTPGVTGVGGAVNLTGSVGGATSGAGGAVVIAGGAGTAGNSIGGAASVTAGAGQGTANGGAATITGGASGAGATGNGGACTQTGGAATSVNGTGGAVGMIGGLGTGTGAGGAVTLTSGAAGATGVAGVVSISVGAATAGNGSAMTLTAGNGAGGTASGGNLNLVPGAAVSTGTPGEVQVNGGSGLISFPLAFTATDATRGFAVVTRAMRLKSASSAFTTASTSGTWTVEKLTGTTAPGSGTALLSAPVALSGSANTVANGSLIATVASLTFAAGDRIGIVIAGTMTNLVGGIGSITFAPC